MKSFQIQIDSKPSLIDLNESFTSFHLNFEVKSENEEQFEALVLSKAEIDEKEDLSAITLKKCPGILRGSIEETSDQENQNYFLIVRNDKPISATVMIDVQEQQPDTISSSSSKDNELMLSSSNSVNKLHNFFNKNFYQIFITFSIILLFYYFRKYITIPLTKSTTLTTSTTTLKNSNTSDPVTTSSTSLSVPPPSIPEVQKQNRNPDLSLSVKEVLESI